MTQTTFFSKLRDYFIGAGSIIVIAFGVMLYSNFIKSESAYEEGLNIVSKETRVLTDRVVLRELSNIGEFATLKYDYSGITSLENQKKVLGLNVPLTKHTIDIVYEGVIKAGIRTSDIEIEVDNETMKIYVSVPQAEILDNYIDLNTLVSREDNNILNPIQANELSDYLIEVENTELSNAISEGIYGKAEINAEELIRDILEPFEDEGYRVVFGKPKRNVSIR